LVAVGAFLVLICLVIPLGTAQLYVTRTSGIVSSSTQTPSLTLGGIDGTGGIQTGSYSAFLEQPRDTDIDCGRTAQCIYLNIDENVCSGQTKIMDSSHPNSRILSTGLEYTTHTTLRGIDYFCSEKKCKGFDYVIEKSCSLGCLLTTGECMCENGYIMRTTEYQGEAYEDAFYCSSGGDILSDVMEYNCKKHEGLVTEDCPLDAPCGPHPAYPQYVACVPKDQATVRNGTYQAYLYPRRSFGNVIHASFNGGKMSTLATYTSKQFFAMGIGKGSTFASTPSRTTTARYPSNLVRRPTVYSSTKYRSTTPRTYTYDPHKTIKPTPTPTPKPKANASRTLVYIRTSTPKYYGYQYIVKSTKPRVVEFETTYPSYAKRDTVSPYYSKRIVTPSTRATPSTSTSTRTAITSTRLNPYKRA